MASYQKRRLLTSALQISLSIVAATVAIRLT